MKYELSQEFYFDAAHTLERKFNIDSSKRIHGHTYHCRITISGTPNPHNGMIQDLALLNESIHIIKDTLDHRLLDEVADLQTPTLENLCNFIWQNFKSLLINPTEVLVERRASGDRCILRES